MPNHLIAAWTPIDQDHPPPHFNVTRLENGNVRVTVRHDVEHNNTAGAIEIPADDWRQLLYEMSEEGWD